VVRKQLYLQERHDTLLKHLARMRGVSEAEIVRQAIELVGARGGSSAILDPAAWERAREFMLSRAWSVRRPRPRRWKREDAYQERLKRHGRRSR
jgi:hypothetical protein